MSAPQKTRALGPRGAAEIAADPPPRTQSSNSRPRPAPVTPQRIYPMSSTLPLLLLLLLLPKVNQERWRRRDSISDTIKDQRRARFVRGTQPRSMQICPDRSQRPNSRPCRLGREELFAVPPCRSPFRHATTLLAACMAVLPSDTRNDCARSAEQLRAEQLRGAERLCAERQQRHGNPRKNKQKRPKKGQNRFHLNCAPQYWVVQRWR